MEPVFVKKTTTRILDGSDIHKRGLRIKQHRIPAHETGDCSVKHGSPSHGLTSTVTWAISS